MSRHFIYRCYDAEDRLLYIGRTRDVEARMAVHRSSKSNPASIQLQVDMARYDVEEVPAEAADELERRAIRDERPLLNVIHNRRPRWESYESARREPTTNLRELLIEWFGRPA